jgi:hypothetical protein
MGEGWDLCLLRGLGDGFFGAALASYQDAYALDHLGGRGGSLRQEDIGVDGAVEGVDGAGDDHRGQAGVEVLGATDELVTIHLRHEEITEEQIDRAGEGLLHELEGLLCGGNGYDAVATGLQQKGADREELFVVVYAEDRLLGAHAVSLLPGGHLVVVRGRWARVERLLVCRRTDLVVSKIHAPWPGRIATPTRVGSSGFSAVSTRRARLSCLLR